MQRQEGSPLQMWYGPSPVLHHARQDMDAAAACPEMHSDTQDSTCNSGPGKGLVRRRVVLVGKSVKLRCAGDVSTGELKRLVRLRKVLCKRSGLDRYQRFLGDCWAQPVLWGAPVDLSAAMVASGNAVVYRQARTLSAAEPCACKGPSTCLEVA